MAQREDKTKQFLHEPLATLGLFYSVLQNGWFIGTFHILVLCILDLLKGHLLCSSIDVVREMMYKSNDHRTVRASYG